MPHPMANAHIMMPVNTLMMPGASTSSKVKPAVGGRKLFVGKLPTDVGASSLRLIMVQYGPVEEIIILRDSSAFVVYEKDSDAHRALTDLRAKSDFVVYNADGDASLQESNNELVQAPPVQAPYFSYSTLYYC